jgi:hypothetical protein
MSRLTFISNADIHTAGPITAAASGVSGVWDLNANAWQAAAALVSGDTVQFVQGKGAASYPLFSQIFDLKGVKCVYTPYTQAVKQTIALTITAAAGVGTIHSAKLVRRATDIGYDKYINSATEDYSFTDKICTIEYVEVAGDTTTTIATAMAAAANLKGKKYGFSAVSAGAVCTIRVAEFGHEFDFLNFAGATANTAAITAKVEGSGNYHQVLSAEKETQAMHGYHGRAGSFLNAPATITSTAIAPVVPSATLGYDCITLYVPNDGDKAIARQNEFTELSLYFDGVNANMANWATVFGITAAGTAEVIQF